MKISISKYYENLVKDREDEFQGFQDLHFTPAMFVHSL